ncbi:Gfo/Idh/MocA family protein [Alkalihalobacillus trypoxylicola]|uniref:Oxidoreductase n=1 Tax=Alkalihalobacillus trypoxylicola TaxID=519424 RepID=A0A162F310_9BACI|nr:Gfo/Idh/MocA family oxidoreductase [Alkalihalobacillus trypoxylicola]KYG34378.1 oxidoreductase [Alkalihalobacillus trypoxylicola]
MIRFGVIGTNWITERLLDSAKEVKDFHLAAVYSRTIERANEFADKWGAVHRFDSLEKMAKSTELDAVYIASPNTFHADQAILFLSEGKHVLCEKPIAANRSEMERMSTLAHSNQVALMEAMKTTLMPGFHTLKDHLPKIGKIRRVVANFCQYSSRYDAYKNGEVLNAFKPELANGALMDIGVYCLYPIIQLFGEPLKSNSNAYMLDSGVDGNGSLTLTYHDMEALLIYSKITNSYLPSEIQGEKGCITIEKFSEMNGITIHYNSGDVEPIHVEEKLPAMSYELLEFVKLIKEKKVESLINSHQTSTLTLKVMDAARKQIGLHFPNDHTT